MNFTPFYKSALIVLSAVAISACDKDFNEIGSGIIGDDHFVFESYPDAAIVANNVATGAVQSNNLPVNPLGVYDNPVFGKTVASFVTQVELTTENPTFTTIEEEPTIESVILTVPYFSKKLSTDSEGASEYELQQIYGIPAGKIKLNVYRSTFFLRDIDYDGDGTQQIQRYYSNQSSDITYNPQRLNNSIINVAENDQFVFNDNEHTEIITTTNAIGETETTTVRTPPGIRLNLDKDLFKEWILDAPAGKLLNNNVFKEYFRGLYFKAEDNGNPGRLAMLDFTQGKITINYKEDKSVPNTTPETTDDEIIRMSKKLVLKMSGNSVSLLQNEPNPNYVAALNSSSPQGADNLYIKGGEGSVAIIDLFSPGELEDIKNADWLINEANLTFHINRNLLGTVATEPERIFIYDVNNKRPLIDYYLDNSVVSDPKKNKFIHDGMIQRDEDERGVMYRIRITNHIRNLVQRDSTNVRLAISVTDNIGDISMKRTRVDNPQLNNFVPTSSVTYPLGTVLYGTGNNVPADKRLKLQIYYTKPD